QSLQQRRRLPELAVLALELADARVDLVQAHRIGIEHRAAAPSWETVAVHVDQVDVGGALRDALLEDLGAFVHQRVDRALHDLLVGDGAPLDAGFARAFDNQVVDDRVRNGRAAARLIAVEARAGLLAEAAHFADPVRDLRIAQVFGTCRREALAAGPADVQSGDRKSTRLNSSHVSI